MRKKPMLAYPVSTKPIDYSKPVFMQPKLDGVRCYITKDGAFSRNHKPFKNCKHIFCKCKYTNKHAQANQHHGKTKSRMYIYTFIISKEPFQSTTTKPCAHCTFYMVLAFGWSR